jgi:hypothetical protein
LILFEAAVRVALLLAGCSERCNKYTQACLRVSIIKTYLAMTFLCHAHVLNMDISSSPAQANEGKKDHVMRDWSTVEDGREKKAHRLVWIEGEREAGH